MGFLGDDLDVIIDLHGHTLHSGLPLLAHPSLTHILRLSFAAGLKQRARRSSTMWSPTRSWPFLNKRPREFTEKLIMLPESYLPADHANLSGFRTDATARYSRGREPHFRFRLRFLIVLPEARLVRILMCGRTSCDEVPRDLY